MVEQMMMPDTRSKTNSEKFLERFPIGSQLTPIEFDQWAREHGLLNTPPDIPKQSDAWLAHLQRRHNLRYSIIKAALRSRVGKDDTLQPFTIDAISGKVWEVRTPHESVIRNKVAESISSLATTKRKGLRVLMDSADWESLPAYEKLFAETLYTNIDDLVERVAGDATRLQKRFAQLEMRLRRAVESGELRSVNGGVKALISGTDDGEHEESV